MRKIILTLVILFIPFSALAEKNFCHDPEANAEWEELINKYPNDKGIQTLHALRIGLCQKVDDDELTIPEATKIFEDMRKTLVEHRERQERAEKDKNKL